MYQTFLAGTAKFTCQYFKYHHSNYFTVVRIYEQNRKYLLKTINVKMCDENYVKKLCNEVAAIIW